MNNDNQSSKIIIYQTEDGQTKIDVQFQMAYAKAHGRTFWSEGTNN